MSEEFWYIADEYVTVEFYCFMLQNQLKCQLYNVYVGPIACTQEQVISKSCFASDEKQVFA